MRLQQTEQNVMAKAPRWRDDDPDDYATEEQPMPARPRIDIPRLKRKLRSKPRKARIPRKPKPLPIYLNKLGRRMEGPITSMKEYPDED